MKRVLLGLLIIIIGVVLILNNLNVIEGFDLGGIIRTFWPLILIAVGLRELARGGADFGGVFLLFLGGFFLLRNLGVKKVEEIGIWPLIIIAFGLVILLTSHKRRPQRSTDDKTLIMNGHYLQADSIKANYSFTSKRWAIYSEDFKGGKINVSFGEVQIDLRNIKIQENIQFNLIATFATIQVILPEKVGAKIAATEFMGQVKDYTNSFGAEKEINFNTDARFATIEFFH